VPRHARVVVPGMPHHVTQRGNYQQRVFRSPGDYRVYCRLVNEHAARHDLNVLAYCLMPNHVHFVVVPGDASSMARTFHAVSMRHSQILNRKNDVKGHLWQGRYFSCVMDEGHLYMAIRYVERNPVRAGLVSVPWAYRWSSARAHTGIAPPEVALTDVTGLLLPGNWRTYLVSDDSELAERIRVRTRRGLAIGSERFLRLLERQIGRPLSVRRRGRPRGAGAP